MEVRPNGFGTLLCSHFYKHHCIPSFHLTCLSIWWIQLQKLLLVTVSAIRKTCLCYPHLFTICHDNFFSWHPLVGNGKTPVWHKCFSPEQHEPHKHIWFCSNLYALSSLHKWPTLVKLIYFWLDHIVVLKIIYPGYLLDWPKFLVYFKVVIGLNPHDILCQ